MTPTPPSPDDDILDLAGLDLDPKKAKASTPESDFEKELEALFAEDLTEPVSKAPVPGDSAGEDILLLDDLVAEPAPAPAQDDDVLDLGDFAAAPEPPSSAADDDVLDLGDFAAAPEQAPAAADDDVLDLGAFATGGELDITPPEDTAGGKDGGIDTAALDDLISGLGEAKEPVAKAEVLPPHDDTDMSDLLETLNVPKAAERLAVPAEPADEMLELSLGDLVEDAPAAPPLSEPVPAAELPDLDISLPDLSDPEPMSLADPEPMALADLEPMALADEDMGGDLNLSLPPEGQDSVGGLDDLDAAPAEGASQLLDTGDLDISGLMEGGMMEGLEAPAEESAVEQSLDPAALLDQFPDGAGTPEAAPAAALTLAAPAEPAPQTAPVPVAALEQLQQQLAALATQVMGGSVAVVRLEGQLAEKDQALAAMEQRLQSSHDEARSLRSELSDLRSQLEETLRQRAQDSDKSASEFKERLALVEDRQIQLDRDVRTEIERAVPREAARVIREEIAALAASMHDE